MRDPVMTQLRHAVRSEITQAFEMAGYARPRAIARQVCAAFPEDIEAVGSRLAEDALTDMARNLLKLSTRHKLAATQLRLPGFDAPGTDALPDAISIPAEDDAADEDGVIYKPLSRATVSELRAHLSLLSAQILADSRRHRALKELLDLALAKGAMPNTLVLAAADVTQPQTAEAA